VGRYVSLERLIEDSREDYYEALHRSSEKWHEGDHDLLPWTNYFLSVLRRAYVLFEERAGEVRSPRGSKTALVEAAIGGLPAGFSIVEVERICPGVSRDMIRRVLRDQQKAGKLESVGRGPGAVWRKRGNNSEKR
jgi:Fic family protein